MNVPGCTITVRTDTAPISTESSYDEGFPFGNYIRNQVGSRKTPSLSTLRLAPGFIELTVEAGFREGCLRRSSAP